MRVCRLILPLLFLLLCAAGMRADSVTLVTGETISGTIKSETSSEIVIDVPISTSIMDERVIRKEDISKINKEQPDEIAYRQLIQIQPNPQISYSSQTYAQVLGELNDFQSKYPNSSYLPDIQKLAATFQDEKSRVDQGEVKYLGQWLNKEEADRRRVQIVAMGYYQIMQRQAASGDLVGAMQTFSTIENGYATTRSYPPAVTLALAVLPKLAQDMATRMQAVNADAAQLKQTIAFTAEPAKSNLIATAKAQQDRDAAVIAAAVASGAKWVPLIPRSRVSVETLQKTAVSEYARLASVPVAAMNASISKVDAARTAMSLRDLLGADALLKQAVQLWPQDEAARYWMERLKEMATPTPKPAPKSTPRAVAAPKPKPHPSVAPTPQVVNIILPPTPAPPPPKPFYMTISGALTIAAAVLVLGGVVAVINQRRAQRELEE